MVPERNGSLLRARGFFITRIGSRGRLTIKADGRKANAAEAETLS